MLLKDRIREGIIILDGATGTELQDRGMPAGVCPEIWCLENPDIISDVHACYRDAGADIVYTATFGANRIKLSQYGVSNVVEINRELTLLARRAVGPDVLLAGDICSTGRFVRPFGDLDFEEAVETYKEQIKGLLEGGVDLFVIETMMDIQETRAALIAVKEMTDKFTIVTMTYEENGRTLNGTDPVTALITLQSLGADAVGCNCSTGPEEMLALIEAMKPWATVPLVAKPNAGMPELIDGKTMFNMNADAFASFGADFVSKGVNLIGGCCGTTPEHIRRLKEKVAGSRPVLPVRDSIGALSSARSSVILEGERPLSIVGERINPTGKKVLQQGLLEGRMSLVRTMAKEQEKMGASLLDVNVGMPGIDEKETMLEAIGTLSVASDLPLVIDSPNIDVIEAVLRLYPGRTLINSISGEIKKTDRLLPLAAKYGAMFILLPLADGDLPETAEERKKIIEDVFKKATALGFMKSDMVIDGLVMAASSNFKAPMETLKTIEWSNDIFKTNTIVGLSNVSFGMPERKWLNSSFLAMAISKGLTMAIANPGIEELVNAKLAGDVLAGRDKDATVYINHFSQVPEKMKQEETFSHKTPGDKVVQAVLEGDREDIEGLLSGAMDAGMGAQKIVDEKMIPAITEAGALFDRREYFLPQLIASAETMKKGIAFLEPYLGNAKLEKKQKGLIIIATVKGDVHDIGKNIVALMLRNHGFEVVDLGRDVSAETIVREAARVKPSVVCLSALMTTTMVNMKEVIELARQEFLDCRFMVGGAVVTKAYADSIGAHYARDGVEAVRVIEELSAYSASL
ncbi:MAG: homocysteine S-methyltransferase family protein [Thermodesulfobacteriota bacterium]|nr:homocysteine S-methyltransferase family protein [Thermodesulfobacteriota bacterium]